MQLGCIIGYNAVTTQAQQTVDGGKAMAVPPERWPQDAESVALIRAKWDDRVGDARQEQPAASRNCWPSAIRPASRATSRVPMPCARSWTRRASSSKTRRKAVAGSSPTR